LAGWPNDIGEEPERMTANDVLKKIEQGEDALIVMVGDSITWGLNHCTAEETYCAHFSRLLANRFPHARVVRYDGVVEKEGQPIDNYGNSIPVQMGNGKQKLTVVRSGVGGDTVLRVMNRVENFTGQVVDGCQPDLITIMLGINDALESDPNKYVSDRIYQIHYRMLVKEIQHRNPDTAILLLTPSYNDPGQSSRSCLDAYSERVKEVAEEFHLSVIDIHQKWMEHLQVESEHYGQRDWLSNHPGDSTHLSPRGAEIMAHHIFDGWMRL